MTTLKSLEATLLYYGKAAEHTFWQAAAASLTAFFGGSGLDLAHLPSVSVLEKVAGAAALAGAAAVLSYVKQLIVLPPPGGESAVETSDVTPATLAAASSVPLPPLPPLAVPDTGVKMADVHPKPSADPPPTA